MTNTPMSSFKYKFTRGYGVLLSPGHGSSYIILGSVDRKAKTLITNESLMESKLQNLDRHRKVAPLPTRSDD